MKYYMEYPVGGLNKCDDAVKRVGGGGQGCGESEDDVSGENRV